MFRFFTATSSLQLSANKSMTKSRECAVLACASDSEGFVRLHPDVAVEKAKGRSLQITLTIPSSCQTLWETGEQIVPVCCPVWLRRPHLENPSNESVSRKLLRKGLKILLVHSGSACTSDPSTINCTTHPASIEKRPQTVLALFQEVYLTSEDLNSSKVCILISTDI